MLQPLARYVHENELGTSSGVFSKDGFADYITGKHYEKYEDIVYYKS